MLIKYIFSAIFFLIGLSITTASAQSTGIIKGQLTDLLTKENMIGASVLVKGTTLGAATDIEGNFTIVGLTQKCEKR